jgi:hypothetical protein
MTNPSDEYAYQDEQRNDGREIGDEYEDTTTDVCPRCGEPVFQYQGDQQMGVSGHWFGVWECLSCGYREYT